MSPKDFRKISHPKQVVSLYWPNFIKKVSQLMAEIYTRNFYLFGNSVKHPGNATKKFLKNISSRTGDIPILF